MPKDFKDSLNSSKKALPQQEITCSKCGQGLGLFGEYWAKFVKNHGWMAHKDCPDKEKAEKWRKEE